MSVAVDGSSMAPPGVAEPVVRVAGLPAEALAALRFEQTSDLVEYLADRRERLATEGVDLAARLYDVIAGSRAGPAVPRLVGLRRALHQGRAPRRYEWDDEVAALLPADLATRVSDWLGEHTTWQSRRADLDQVLSAELTDKVATLRRLASDPRLRRALWHASSALSRELDKWLADRDRTPRRQFLLRLTKYLTRAAAKTAVFSSFTVAGLGRWRQDGPAVQLAGGPRLRTVAELDDNTRDALLRALMRFPPLHQELVARVNPSLTVDRDQIVYIGPPPRESIRTVPATPAVRELLEVMAPVGRCTVRALHDHLCSGYASDSTTVRRFLAHLVEIGLLEAAPPGQPMLATPICGLAGWATEGSDEADELAQGLRRVAHGLRAAERASEVTAHRARHEALGTAVTALRATLGAPTDTPRVARDNLIATEPVADCSAARFRPILQDLDGLRSWMAAFDAALPWRVAVASWWSRRFPDDRRLPFLIVHREIQREMVSGSEIGNELLRLSIWVDKAPPDLATSPLPEVRAVEAHRADALTLFDRPPDPDGVVRVCPDELTTTASTWPRWVRAIPSMGCHLQLVDGTEEEGDPTAVLLRLDTGFGKQASRIAFLIGSASGRLDGERSSHPVGAGAAEEEEGEVLADVGGLLHFAANGRVPTLPYDIDYPFSASERPPSQRLPLSDLWVEYEPASPLLRVRSQSLGRPVVAAHTGQLASVYLPRAAHFLVRTFGCPWPRRAVPLPGRSLRELVAARISDVLRRPRVCVGSVVVRPAQWVMRPPAIPNRSGSDSDADYLLRLASWRRRHQIPTRSFVRAIPVGLVDGDPTRGPDPQRTQNSVKPFFLDTDNWFLVLAFENLMRTPRDIVVFEEALPDPSAAPHANGSRWVTELIVEVPPTGRSGGGADDR